MAKRRHIRHYRTDRVGKKPLESLIEYGELAINYADGGEKLFIKNTSDEIVSFISENEADQKYQPAGEYLTEHQDISGKANVNDVYTKDEIDNTVSSINEAIDTKADKATTLEGYGIEDAYTKDDVDGIISTINTAIDTKANADDVYAKSEVYTKSETEGYVTTQIDNLINGAPEAMDTLKELADAIGENETIIDGLNNLVNEKADKEDVYTKDEIDSQLQALQKNIDEIDLGEYEADAIEFVGHTQIEGDQYSFTYNGNSLTVTDGETVALSANGVNSLDSMFSGCSGLTTLDLSNFDTSNVTGMGSMFYSCLKLTSLDVSNFDTSNVTNMNSMFSCCYGLTTLDLSNFDTSNVTNMGSMFYSCRKLTSLDVSNFDTSNVTYMNGMFSNCYGLTTLDLSNFDTSNVTGMGSMFWDCYGLTTLDLSNFDTSKVTYMNSMFSGCSGLTTLDLSNFDTSNVTDMAYMFNNCSRLTTLDLSNFDTSKVTSMGRMFDDCESLRYVTLGENFFKTTQPIPFYGAPNLGFNEDGTDNGWLEHLATVAPTITDGQSRTLQLHANLKNASWAATHLETLQTKGYTIA